MIKMKDTASKMKVEKKHKVVIRNGFKVKVPIPVTAKDIWGNSKRKSICTRKT